MEVGNWNKLPHYTVVGTPTKFYVWVNENGKGSSSTWLSGKEAFAKWFELKRYFKSNKQQFIALIKTIHQSSTRNI